MTRRGRKRRLVLEDEYWKLILDGVPTVEACRQFGIGRKTGYGGTLKRAACRRRGGPKKRSRPGLGLDYPDIILSGHHVEVWGTSTRRAGTRYP
jgi:hypothetical protein